ncbi:MAG: ribosome recycling factor [Actinomycetota bacterium]
MIEAEVLKVAEDKMRKALFVTREELASIRTGRASPRFVERLDVNYYGSKVALNQIAGISVPEARLLLITPFDRNALGSIERAILASDLGITPSNDGTAIRLVFPPLTQERRRDLIRLSRERGEEGRVAIRNVRRHVKEDLTKREREGELSEDDLKRGEKELQRVTDRFVVEIDEMVVHKEQDLLEI